MEFTEVIKKYGKKLDDLSEAEYYDVVKRFVLRTKKCIGFIRPDFIN